MSKSKEKLKKETDILINQGYNEIPDHEMIGKTLRMIRESNIKIIPMLY